jgi:RND family efflux transporter MFP subunit
MRDKDVRAAEAAVDQAQAVVDTAQQNLSYVQIHSPVDGVVQEKLADVGQSLGANASVLRLATDQSLYLEATVSELEALRVQNGQPVNIKVDATQGDRASVYEGAAANIVKGTVERVVRVVDERTRDFVVRIVLPKQATLFPGMFTRGSIVVAHHKQVLTVPKSAIINKGDKQVLFVVSAEKAAGDTPSASEALVARQREVTLGASSSTAVEVRLGVQAGERVIIEGQQTLADQDPVTITDGGIGAGSAG